MSFIVQISPFVPLFTLKIVFRWGDLPPEPSHCPTLDLLGALTRPPRPKDMKYILILSWKQYKNRSC
jgi:hypothetical protein